LLKASCSW